MAKERDIQIDILRCIGLLLVILAHVPINETVKSITVIRCNATGYDCWN